MCALRGFHLTAFSKASEFGSIKAFKLNQEVNQETGWYSYKDINERTNLNLPGKFLLALFPIVALTLIVLGPGFKEPALQSRVLRTHYPDICRSF